MRTVRLIPPPTGAAAVRRWLRERIAEVERGGAAGSPRGAAPTGWGPIDAALPEGGLRYGATHEWLDMGARGLHTRVTPMRPRQAGPQGQTQARVWSPPIFILAHLARAAAGGGWTVWIGRRVWPYPHTLVRAGGVCALEHAILIDPPDDAMRLWSIDQSLRCPRMVVVADASRLRFAPSRRLQLAAEAGGSLALLARPGRERAERSAAATRWEVSRCAARGGTQWWAVRLARCKGAAPSSLSEWVLERGRGGGVVVVAADVGDGHRASAEAS